MVFVKEGKNKNVKKSLEHLQISNKFSRNKLFKIICKKYRYFFRKKIIN